VLGTEIQDRPRKVRSLWKRAWPFCKGATSVNPTLGGGIIWRSGGQ
jgi:hypothetical protein